MASSVDLKSQSEKPDDKILEENKLQLLHLCSHQSLHELEAALLTAVEPCSTPDADRHSIFDC